MVSLKQITSCIAAILIVAATTLVSATESIQSHHSIQQVAEQYMRDTLLPADSEAEILAGQLDSRLRLRQCTQDLEAFFKSFQTVKSKMTIGIRCNDAQGWTIYVPMQVAIYKEVVVSLNEIPRNSVINSNDLTTQKQDITRLRRGYYEKISQLSGKRSKRRLNQNTVITPSMVAIPKVVKRGNRVTILAATGNIAVRMNGKALGNGAEGDRVRVLNTNSEREVEATVIGPGLVQVTL